MVCYFHTQHNNLMQFFIATHSPFILSISNAKIYDLDSVPVLTKK